MHALKKISKKKLKILLDNGFVELVDGKYVETPKFRNKLFRKQLLAIL